MILTACLLLPALAPLPPRAAGPPTALPPVEAQSVLLARLPHLDAQGRQQFLGAGAAPGGRLLLVLEPRGLEDVDHALPDRPRTGRLLQADGEGRVRFALPAAEGLSVRLWRPGDAWLPREASRALSLAPVLAANYSGPPAVISEFMKDPTDVSDSHGEWVEISNLNPWRLNLEGWVLSDDSGNASILGGGATVLRCGPGQSIVVGADADPSTNGGVPVMGEWSGFTLRNSSDEIILSTPDGQVVDRVDYDDGVNWPDSPGQSIALDPQALDVVANDDPANWCHSSTVWPGGVSDTGSPGAPNQSCP